MCFGSIMVVKPGVGTKLWLLDRSLTVKDIPLIHTFFTPKQPFI